MANLPLSNDGFMSAMSGGNPLLTFGRAILAVVGKITYILGRCWSNCGLRVVMVHQIFCKPWSLDMIVTGSVCLSKAVQAELCDMCSVRSGSILKLFFLL